MNINLSGRENLKLLHQYILNYVSHTDSIVYRDACVKRLKFKHLYFQFYVISRISIHMIYLKWIYIFFCHLTNQISVKCIFQFETIFKRNIIQQRNVDLLHPVVWNITQSFDILCPKGKLNFFPWFWFQSFFKKSAPLL